MPVHIIRNFLLAGALCLGCGDDCPPGQHAVYGAGENTSGSSDPCPDCSPAERNAWAQQDNSRTCVPDRR